MRIAAIQKNWWSRSGPARLLSSLSQRAVLQRSLQQHKWAATAAVLPIDENRLRAVSPFVRFTRPLTILHSSDCAASGHPAEGWGAPLDQGRWQRLGAECLGVRDAARPDADAAAEGRIIASRLCAAVRARGSAGRWRRHALRDVERERHRGCALLGEMRIECGTRDASRLVRCRPHLQGEMRIECGTRDASRLVRCRSHLQRATDGRLPRIRQRCGRLPDAA